MFSSGSTGSSGNSSRERTQQPNPPIWPKSVLIFNPQCRYIEEVIDYYTKDLQSQSGHFSDKRIVVMFEPGEYSINVPVGYYVQVIGLGKNISDVIFTAGEHGNKHGAYCHAADPGYAGSLDTFWRCAENFTHRAILPGNNNNTGIKGNKYGMLWAVSQAAPLRRIVIDGDLLLHDKGMYASGGFAANLHVSGVLDFGSQQQWMIRNSTLLGGSTYGAWSFVFVGTEGAPVVQSKTEHQQAYTTVDNTPIIAEKPYITIDSKDGKFYLQVPPFQSDSRGMPTDSSEGADITENTVYGFEVVYVADAQRDTTLSIQAQIDVGYHIVFSPGIYKLDTTLIVRYHEQVLLGLGLATLVASKDGCIRIPSGLYGVRIAGIMLQASSPCAHCLLQCGDEIDETFTNEFSNSVLDNQKVSCVLNDIFARVGGPSPDHTGTDTGTSSQRTDIGVRDMVRIYASRVIGDHLWLWRADHAVLENSERPRRGEIYHLVVGDEYTCDTGLHVYGNDVTIYGLAVEHTQKDQVVWAGERGRTYFYQCELPYEVSTEQYADYVGYKVAENVCVHQALGIGIYSFFRDNECLVKTAISHPETPDIEFTNAFTMYLDGFSGILSVKNGKGGSVGKYLKRTGHLDE